MELTPQNAPDLSVSLGALRLKNPVLTASGTFGYGQEIADLVDLSGLGAIATKTVTRAPRSGNPAPRTCEVTGGMLNAIGLQNVGIEVFLREKMPFLQGCGAPVVVNIAGETVEDFAFLCEQIEGTPGVSAIELNISCPNVSHGLDFATDPHLAEQVVRAAKKATSLPIFAKLSPNVTDISVIARGAQNGGADALCVANTFVGLSINVKTRRPRIANITGGMSGPAIKPLALRAVWKCAGAVQIPIIGIGGICTVNDALEFLIAGATGVQVGTATFVQPDAALQIVRGLEDYCRENKLSSIREIIGTLQT